ncbi:hypothetical protein [Hyphomonas sp.]|uniref:hypothetical protein n=1 Tax=Hyphomonas sp. TaxID=87 RepID=UPI0039187DDF
MRGISTLILAGASLAGPAAAAPWVREEGGWYSRALVAHDRLDGASGWRTDLYGEYGLTPKLTVTAKSERVTFEGAAEFNRDSYRLTLRRELFAHRGWVGGIEAGAVHGSTVTGADRACDGAGFETRLGTGWSGVSKEGRARYAFADIARIEQQGGCTRNRIEFGYGTDLAERIFLTEQLWLEDGTRSARSVKAETQLGVRFSEFDVSLGYRQEYGGLFSERAVLVAVVARR